MAELRVLSTIPAQEGWRCVFRGPEPEREPLRLEPVAGWGVVVGAPGSEGAEVCPLLQVAAPGRLPELRPIVHGLASHCPPGFLGVAAPGEDLGPWIARARGEP